MEVHNVNTEIKDFILSVLVDEFNLKIDKASVTRETSLGDGGLNLESLTFVELAFKLEDRYGIEVPEDDMDKIASFKTGDLVDYIDKKVREAS
jgi:acyl carrier protein